MTTCRHCGHASDPELPYCGMCGAHLAGAQSGIQPFGVRMPGAMVGPYRLVALLGEGGMGSVYMAEHVRLGRTVALKILHPEHGNRRHAVRRFITEARAVNRISHPNIVEITDCVENVGGETYIVMEFLEGEDLQVVRSREHLPLWRALDVALQVASALAAVHEAGIVHRDLKPENIFLTKRGGPNPFVKLLDFGIAKLLDPDEGASRTTTQGVVLGTVEYMAPEQAGGQDIDHRADIYSFGVILYEVATGKRPFEAATVVEMVANHLSGKFEKPGRVQGMPHLIPRDLEDLIVECLARDPKDRPQSMREVHTRLHKIFDENWGDANPLMGRNRRRVATWMRVSAATLMLATGVIVGYEGGRFEALKQKLMPDEAATAVDESAVGASAQFLALPDGVSSSPDQSLSEPEPAWLEPIVAVTQALECSQEDRPLRGERDRGAEPDDAPAPATEAVREEKPNEPKKSKASRKRRRTHRKQSPPTGKAQRFVRATP